MVVSFLWKAIKGTLVGGFGSTYDNAIINIGICDDCIKKHYYVRKETLIDTLSDK